MADPNLLTRLSYQRALEAQNPLLGWWRPGAESSLKLDYSKLNYPQVGFPGSAHEAGQRVRTGFEDFSNLGDDVQVPSVLSPENMALANYPERDELGRATQPQGVMDFLAGLQGNQATPVPGYSGMEDRTPLPPMLNGGYTGKGYSPGLFAPGPMSSIYDVPDPAAAAPPPPAGAEGATGIVGGVGGGVAGGGGSVVGRGGAIGPSANLPQYPLIDPSTYPQPPQRELLDTNIDKYYDAEKALLEQLRPKEPEETGLGGMILQALAGGAIGLAAGGSPQAGVAGALGALALGQREEAADKEKYQDRVDAFNREFIGLEREKGREARQITRDNASIDFSNKSDTFRHETGIIDTNVDREFKNKQIQFEYQQKQLDRAREDAARAATQWDTRIQILDDGTAVAIRTHKPTGKFSVEQFSFSKQLEQTKAAEAQAKALGGVKIRLGEADTFGQVPPEMRPALVRVKNDSENNDPRWRVVVEDEKINVLLNDGQITPEEAGIDPVTGVMDPSKRNEVAISTALGAYNQLKPGYVQAQAEKAAIEKLGRHYYNQERSGAYSR